MKKQNFQSQHGFNLVELLVALAIMSIGLLIAVPSFTSLTSSNTLSGQASEIQTALNYARSEAIRLNDNIVFCHSADGLVCSAPANNVWQGWIVSRAGPNIGAEIVPALRQGAVDAQILRVTSGAPLQTALHVVRYNSQGLARFFANNAPLSANINVCMARSSIELNLHSVNFNSGGRSEIAQVNNGGVCP